MSVLAFTSAQQDSVMSDSDTSFAGMTGEEFKAAIRTLGHTQLSFAAKYSVGKRTVATWAERGPPEYVIAILRDLFENRILLASEIEDHTDSDIDKAFLQAFARIARDAERGGYTPDQIAEAADRFFASYREASRQRDSLLKPQLKMANLA